MTPLNQLARKFRRRANRNLELADCAQSNDEKRNYERIALAYLTCATHLENALAELQQDVDKAAWMTAYIRKQL